jgi:hypothetical protein
LNQTFRDLYRINTLGDQPEVVSQPDIFFTDLRGSTELCERVGDLVAFGSGAGEAAHENAMLSPPPTTFLSR